MQINNELSVSIHIAGGGPLTLKEGEQLHAVVKERFPNNEALLTVKGHDIRVRFSGGLPSTDQVIIKVADLSQDLPAVEAVKAPALEPPRTSGRPPLQIPAHVKGDLRRAVEILASKNVPVTAQMLRDLAVFFEKGSGSAAEKLETVRMMAEKGLEFTPAQITAVHQALHDSSLKDELAELLARLAGERAAVPRLPENVPVLAGEWAEEPGTPAGDPADRWLKALKKEPDIGKIAAMLQRELAASGMLSEAQQDMLLRAADMALSMAQSGRELAARRLLADAAEQMAWEKKGSPEPPSPQGAYGLSAEFLAALPADSKDYIVATVTEKLSQLAIDFKQLKREMLRHLSAAETLIRPHQANAATVLETVIKQLDRAILKSDIMLFTDMETEKTLLRASSLLADARKQLAAGNAEASRRIVAEVRDMLAQLHFKPADVKVRHFVTEKLLAWEPPGPGAQAAAAAEASLREVKQLSSGRAVYEVLKKLGLNYESGLLQTLAAKGNDEAAASLKEALLRLLQHREELSTAQKAEQIINNLTGQQLLSKNDSSALQTMMFILPFLLQEKAEQVKVFIKSQRKKEKVDWENCQLYFLLETKKLGDVGILLTVADRNLSVTIQNDKPDFPAKTAPMADALKERLEDIGYRVASVRFDKFSLEKTAKSPSSRTKGRAVRLPEGGIDLTV